jgi:hypothetical protein
MEAASYFQVAANNIRNAIKTKNTACGYLWTEEYTHTLDISLYKLHVSHEYVYKFDEAGKLSGTYKSVEDAAAANNNTTRLIFNAIAGKTKSKGFYYSYDKTFKPQSSTYNKLTTIYLYNLDGSFYKEFSSPRECADHFGDVKTSRLYAAVRTGGLYHQFQVSKVYVDKMKELASVNTPRKILQYDLDGNLIKE